MGQPFESPFKDLRRHSRISLTALHDVKFFFKDALYDFEVELTNLSQGGLGFLAVYADSDPDASPEAQKDEGAEEVRWPALGTYIRGELLIRERSFSVMLRLVFKSAKVIGCSFSEKESGLDEKIEEYFKVELSALKMKRVASNQIKSVSDGVPHWIFGSNNCELYFVMKEEEMVRFNFSFFANYVEGGKEKKTKYGQVISSQNDTDDLMYKAADLIHWEDQSSSSIKELKETAIKFLENISSLKAEERVKIQSYL